MLKLFSEVACVDPARVYTPTLGDIAHCHSADTLINLSRLPATPSSDSLVLLLSTGTHYWTCVLLEPCGMQPAALRRGRPTHGTHLRPRSSVAAAHRSTG
jgi:hypothetical protein